MLLLSNALLFKRDINQWWYWISPAAIKIRHIVDIHDGDIIAWCCKGTVFAAD